MSKFAPKKKQPALNSLSTSQLQAHGNQGTSDALSQRSKNKTGTDI